MASLTLPGPRARRFCYQFLQMEQDIDYPDGAELRTEQTQEFLYQQLFAPGALAHPPPPRYQLRVLKALVDRIEASIEDWEEHGVSDNLMSSLSSLLAMPLPPEATAAQQKCYVTYHLSTLSGSRTSPPQITLLESRALIAASGTTGLRTWEAALHLGQYFCAHPALINGKRVLELGAGTGYLSVLCAKHLGGAHCLASDGSDDVINNLPDNFFLNGLEGLGVVSPMDLKWGHALVGTEEADWNGGRPLDVVLGADITYDRAVIPALVATLQELVSLFPGLAVIISATERNRETYEVFKTASVKGGFVVETLDFKVPSREQQSGPFYSADVPIHVCQLRRGR